MRFISCIAILLILGTGDLYAQQTYKVGLVGFYNLENLFDTLDTPDVRDTEFTPTGSKNYDTEVYRDKLANLSRVLSEIGTELSPDGLAVFG
ncbi:MAG: endonuclease, partial [Bacteroidetes bacterium]